MFTSRTDAGRKLAAALKPYSGSPSIVLGIPRGGVEVAYEVAKALGVKLGLLVVRKLPLPDNPEAGFGALAEDGSVYIQPGTTRMLPSSIIQQTIHRQRLEVERRKSVLRGAHSLPDFRRRRILLVDDGIAMGSTMQAAIACCRNLGASWITVATPVASPRARTSLEQTADKVVALLCPPFFQAVAEFYTDWHDGTDEDVRRIMDKAKESNIAENGYRGASPVGAPSQNGASERE